MKLTLAYFKTFNKIIFFEKIPFLYSIAFPTCLFLFNNFDALTSTSWTTSQLILQTANYVAYIIVSVTINGIGIQLINFRESGFLKTYTMISGGDKRYGVIGLLLSELLFGYCGVLIFGLVISLFNLKNIALLLILYTLAYLIAATPVFLLSIALGTLALRINTIVTLVNIGLFAMIGISAVRVDTHSLLGEFAYGLNPIDFVSQVLLLVNQTIHNLAAVEFYQAAAVLALLIIFVTIGIVSIPRVQLNSVNMRN